jgi:hypothetical protein
VALAGSREEGVEAESTRTDGPASGIGNASGSGRRRDVPEGGISPNTPGDALHADLILKSSPPFAETFLDGRFIGVTPVRVESFLAGRHRLAMRSDRTHGVDTLLDIPPGKHTLKVQLGNEAVARIAASQDEGE